MAGKSFDQYCIIRDENTKPAFSKLGDSSFMTALSFPSAAPTGSICHPFCAVARSLPGDIPHRGPLGHDFIQMIDLFRGVNSVAIDALSSCLGLIDKRRVVYDSAGQACETLFWLEPAWTGEPRPTLHLSPSLQPVLASSWRHRIRCQGGHDDATGAAGQPQQTRRSMTGCVAGRNGLPAASA